MRTVRLVCAVGAAIAAAVALTGCSSTPQAPDPTWTNTLHADGSISVDGKDQGPVTLVLCQPGLGGALRITLRSPAPELGITLRDNATVIDSVSMNGSDNATTLTYVAGPPGAGNGGMEAHLIRSGQTFIFTGTGIGHAGAYDKEILVPFRITATCP